MGIPQPQVACKLPLHFLTLIDFGEVIVPEWSKKYPISNGFFLCKQGLWVVEKPPSVFLGISEYMRRPKDSEEDLEREN